MRTVKVKINCDEFHCGKCRKRVQLKEPYFHCTEFTNEKGGALRLEFDSDQGAYKRCQQCLEADRGMNDE